ncbi:MAG: prolyl oligopeptidase family serine peptidase [Acidobacteriota bacterium]|nr:prolyl oligopeptidase family serine peptidase [Acidobacteriota bacterium]
MRRIAKLVLIAGLAAALPAAAEDSVIREALVLRLPRGLQRSVWALDPVEAALATGVWKAPRAGDKIAFSASASASWEALRADENGWFGELGEAYVYARVASGQTRTAILNGLGDSYVFVNGEPRMGAKYAVKETYEAWEPRFDYGQVPVRLRKGDNHLLFRCQRGRFKAVLSEAPAPLLFNERDMTLPDVLAGEPVDAWGAVVVMNASGETRRGLTLTASGPGLEPVTTAIGDLQPYRVRKVPFRMKGKGPVSSGTSTVTLVLNGGPSPAAPSLSFPLVGKTPGQNHKRTYLSAIDGSVQYYAVNPARSTEAGFKPGLVLSVHGASVEATNQVGAYEPKTWAHIVAATNRRPYGFDWEDWGRMDTLEAMADFTSRYPVDPSRVYLTGHSMGGHGAWILGALFPDRFAAVGPSAGWISFKTYSSRQKDEGRTPAEKLASRPLLQGDTLALVRNFVDLGVYILHGDKDDSVPVDQARQMAQTLAGFHKDFVYWEEKGASHWWDKSDEPGTDCVDWAPLFDFFARHARPFPGTVRDVEFTTPNPGVSASRHWARIEAQTVPLAASTVRLRVDPGARRFSGTTDNVARLALDVSMMAEPGNIAVEIDGQTLQAAPLDGTLWLYRTAGTWQAGGRPSPSLKGPRRNGPFKDAFRNRMLFVYGTQGGAEENDWAYAKARFDAELFQYQGNGSVELRPDRDFDPGLEPDRNVILYGNAATNGAWKALLGDSPVQVGRGFIQAGPNRFDGRGLAALFLRPRPGSDTACVGVVAGTGIRGMRLTNARPYLLAGYALPDLVVFDAGAAKPGDGGLRLAGFFGPDWGFPTGEFARD